MVLIIVKSTFNTRRAWYHEQPEDVKQRFMGCGLSRKGLFPRFVYTLKHGEEPEWDPEEEELNPGCYSSPVSGSPPLTPPAMFAFAPNVTALPPAPAPPPSAAAAAVPLPPPPPTAAAAAPLPPPPPPVAAVPPPSLPQMCVFSVEALPVELSPSLARIREELLRPEHSKLVTPTGPERIHSSPQGFRLLIEFCGRHIIEQQAEVAAMGFNWPRYKDINFELIESRVLSLRTELAEIVRFPAGNLIFRRLFTQFMKHGERVMRSLDGLEMCMPYEHAG
ncbi:hypothetical protein K439DRAFT_1623833 [Ramaria rubella]|nr:hypothetical protein K439DRAFT_1623833 [Ramaria rubella]